MSNEKKPTPPAPPAPVPPAPAAPVAGEPPKKKKLSLDIDEVDVSEVLERKISA